MRKLPTFFIVFMLIEIAGFILVGKLIGLMMTLLLIVLSSVIGILILRVEGLSMLYQNIQTIQAMQQGRGVVPPEFASGWKILAGLLLLIPGFITDIMGLLLLIPGVQQWLGKRIMNYFNSVTIETQTMYRRDTKTHHRTIEGERVDPPSSEEHADQHDDDDHDSQIKK